MLITFILLLRDRDIRDRSILRLYETDALVGSSPAGCFSTSAFPIQQQAFVGGCESGGGIVTNSSASSGIGSPRLTTIEVTSGGSPSPGNFWDPDVSYFSEPEFDSDYRYRHVHKSVKVKVLCAPLLGLDCGTSKGSFLPGIVVNASKGLDWPHVYATCISRVKEENVS